MDFVKWRIYFEEEILNGFHREDYFLAQIAQYIAKANSKDPEKIKIDPFLLKFTKDSPPQHEVGKGDQRHARSVQSRIAWGMGMGVSIPLNEQDESQDESQEVLPFPPPPQSG